MEFVFIIGIARTGSKIYKNILNEHSEINILNELHFLAPRWIRKDFRYYFKRYFGNINSKNDVSKLIDIMYSGKLNGSFWTTKSWNVKGVQNSIIGVDKNTLKRELLNSNYSYKEIFKILVEQHTIARNKNRGGAKFPVDISFVPTLMGWFPESKVIHIIRDPRAIYTSMVHMDKRSFVNKYKLKNYIINIKRFIYLIWQYKLAVKIHKRYSGNNNYYLSRFEDIVTEPEKYLKKLCEFLKINFQEDMLNPNVVDSSYKNIEKKTGFDKKALNRWKDHISPKGEFLIKLLLKSEIKEMGYT